MYGQFYSTHPPACEKHEWEDLGQGECWNVWQLVKNFKPSKYIFGQLSPFKPAINEYIFPDFTLSITDNSLCEKFGDFTDIWNYSILAKDEIVADKIGKNLIGILEDFS